MSSDRLFSLTPTCNISRTKMNFTKTHKTSFNLGDIVPLYTNPDIAPGSTYSIDLASFIRMSTPIAPIMDNIYFDVYAFFIPHRLVYDDWTKVHGENTSGYWTAGSASVPLISSSSSIVPGCLGHYMGIPVGCPQSKSNVLAGRAYALVWNEWFRDQNLQVPLAITKNNAGTITSGGSFSYVSNCLKANKFHDVFTSCLPGAQKGNAVTIPLGLTAPVILGPDHANINLIDSNVDLTWMDSANGPLPPAQYQLFTGDSGDSTRGTLGTYQADKSHLVPDNLVADLSTATAATINQLRYAFQIQKLLEKDALYGTRYFELLQAHFGVTNPDARLQRPEYLGGKRIHINIEQVLQTTGYQAGATTELGVPGANSVTANNAGIFTKSFTEHGTLLILGVARHARSYSQGIPLGFTKTNRYDYYYPVLANIGNVVVKTEQLFWNSSANFGYQEAWWEYRYEPNQASGLLDPNVTGSLDFWTLTEKFSVAPTLSGSFIQEDRLNLSRCLSTSTNGPDFIADFYFHGTKVLPMPLYSVPGFIDHH